MGVETDCGSMATEAQTDEEDATEASIKVHELIHDPGGSPHMMMTTTGIMQTPGGGGSCSGY